MIKDDIDAPPGSTSPDVFQQLGQITRQLHDSLGQLSVLLDLRHSAEDLCDARSRLQYIARKTGEAADKVLTAVEQAKLESAALTRAARQRPGDAFASHVERGLACIDERLTDIMLAQDFHDLTGQVVAKVVALAGDLEDSLVKLLVSSAPADHARRTEGAGLAGPVVHGSARGDVVKDQAEVDDLLASLGF